jgi:hypothetical protein
LIELTVYRVWASTLKKRHKANTELQISVSIDCAHFAAFPTQATRLLVVAVTMFVPGAIILAVDSIIESRDGAFEQFTIVEDNTNHKEHL